MEQQARKTRPRTAARPPVDFKGKLGERLTTAMEKAGFTRAWFGIEVTNLSGRMTNEADIRRWSNGQATPDASRLGHLADALGVTVDYLLGRAESPLGVVVPGWGEVSLDADIKRGLEALTASMGDPTPGEYCDPE